MPNKNETVILLHGIGHNRTYMWLLERVLKKRGYQTLNLTYPSVKKDIKSLSKWLHNTLAEKQVWHATSKAHFVTHSMGGLVSGFYLEDFKGSIPTDKLGRVVMMGTPHGGSEVADGLEDFWLYKLVFGPAGQELTTHARTKDQIKPYYELGIIAGTQNWPYPLGRVFIDQPHDGCVSVESTKLDTMKDHIILPVFHGLMGWSTKTQEQVLYFLEYGEFQHAV